ncbi:IS256 family transposase [[Mycoplasma] testudinis]|uniref:IS256 family transposase n=1 Tax=[Mycoplasma] testudinis TaxID=33924 RepID=UPI000488D275
MKLYNKSLDQAAISRITDRVLIDLKEFQNRPLDKIYPFWYIDAFRFHSREDGQAKLVSVYVILGVDLKGYKHVIGLYIGENETSKEWLKFFNDLKQRGVERVLMVISNNLTGISEAINTAFPKAMIQKCVVHQVRNSLLRVSNYDMASLLKRYESNLQCSRY